MLYAAIYMLINESASFHHFVEVCLHYLFLDLVCWCRIFLLIQLLSIVNFVYIWNESWISPENERQWYVIENLCFNLFW